MHAIIAGCGRVGAQLAATLDAEGADVAVIDKDPAAFGRLPQDFGGRTIEGMVFDRLTLEAAGAEHADVFVAVTSGDNSNIVAARTARERFAVERVVARIYDPARAEIFARLGVDVIAAAQWTAETILRTLAVTEERVEGAIGSGAGDVVLVSMNVPATCHGIAVGTLSRPGRSVVTAITRGGVTAVPERDGLLEDGDTIHVVVERGHLDDLRRAVGLLGVED